MRNVETPIDNINEGLDASSEFPPKEFTIRKLASRTLAWLDIPDSPGETAFERLAIWAPDLGYTQNTSICATGVSQRSDRDADYDGD